MRMAMHNNRIKSQIEEGANKKKYGMLMTEHERRVNDRDINAFEVQEN